MCGIVGFWGQFAPEAEQEHILWKMTNSLAHRGPDGTQIWHRGHIGLGHRRLSIVDLETGTQPMWDADNRCVIVCNGEIYNSPQLRQQLINRGHRFLTKSDTEVIPATLQEWGIEEGLRRLRGMFAFALYNTETHNLLLARDRVGIKPLYWARRGSSYFWASEPKALLLSGLASRQIDPVAIHDFLAFGYGITPRTCWRDIQLLPPGSWMEICPQGQRSGVYWEWTPATQPDLTESQAYQGYKDTLKDALRAHLLSDVPLGAFLSGGIDSSLIVSILAKELYPGLQTYNVGFDEASYDEAPFARQVADKYQTTHHEIVLQSESASPELFSRIVSQFDEPFADSSCIPTYIVSQEMAKHVKVVLSGDGGDEVMGGYVRYRSFCKISHLARVNWASPIVEPLLTAAQILPINAIWRMANAWSLARGTHIDRIAQLHSTFSEEERRAGYKPEFYGRAYAQGPTSARLAHFVPESIGDPVDQLLTAEMRLRLHADYLRKVDISSSAHGLEVRVPFLDNEVLEFSQIIPTNLKIRPRSLKYLSRKLAREYLPGSLADRPKQGFGIPFDDWTKGATLEYLSDLFLSPTSHWRELFVDDFVTEPWQLFIGEQRSRHLKGPSISQRVFAFAALEVWLRKWSPELY